MNDRIAALRAELAAAEKDEAARLADLQRRTVVIRRFVIAPDDRHHDKLYDSTLRWYRLAGEVTNHLELAAAGISAYDGWSSYLYNVATSCIVMRYGGGHIFIPHGALFHGEKRVRVEAEAVRVYAELGEFLYRHPEGGDVTDIVNSHREPE